MKSCAMTLLMFQQVVFYRICDKFSIYCLIVVGRDTMEWDICRVACWPE